MAPTVIAHSDVRNDLLQDSLPFRELLVLALGREQLRSKLLWNYKHASAKAWGR
jgi:hypothetical protein